MANWSGLWDRQYGTPYSQLGGNTKEFNSTEKAEVARLFRGRGSRIMGAVLRALTGAAVGGTATQTYRQVASEGDINAGLSNGGKRTVNTVTDINRVTTSADETLIDEMTTRLNAPTSYPTDKGGGGGGKLGSF